MPDTIRMAASRISNPRITPDIFTQGDHQPAPHSRRRSGQVGGQHGLAVAGRHRMHRAKDDSHRQEGEESRPAAVRKDFDVFGEGEIDVPLDVYDLLQQRLMPSSKKWLQRPMLAIQTRFRNRANDSRASVNGEIGHLMTAEVTDPCLMPSMAIWDGGCR
ncbi:hypothetical protein ABIA18_001817 [Sinorhizobium fredii]